MFHLCLRIATPSLNQNKNTSTKEGKEARAQLERKILIDMVASGTISTVKDKIAFILNNYKEGRNSDIKLAYVFWRVDLENFVYRSESFQTVLQNTVSAV